MKIAMDMTTADARATVRALAQQLGMAAIDLQEAMDRGDPALKLARSIRATASTCAVLIEAVDHEAKRQIDAAATATHRTQKG